MHGAIVDFPLLLSPYEHGRLSLRNRIVFPAHQTLYSDAGRVSDRLRDYYVERAKGGVGAIVVEGGAVHPTTIKFPSYLRFYDPDVVPSVRSLVAAVQAAGAKVIVQLAHSGSRMATWDSREPLWAPSDVHSANSLEIPHVMTKEDIAELLTGYRRTAELMASAGVDGIEVHSAHEYLLGEFLSPHNNRRNDEYGGTLANRARLAIEAITAVRETVGDELVVGVRMNGSDLFDGGNTTADYVEVARLFDATGALDYISVSAATSADNHLIVPPMDVAQGVHVEHAAAIKQVVSAAVFTVGRIKRPEHAEQILADGKADVIAMARSLIADPEFPRKAATDPSRIRPCIGANDGCYGRLVRVRPISCVVNPAVGLERDLGIGSQQPAATRRRVVVVGGGPAGLEAARVAADRGHEVTLLEASDAIGGQLRLATRLDHRRELWELVAFQQSELERSGVDVRLGTTADVATITDLTPDVVVVATGSTPRPLPLPLADAGELRILSVPDAIAWAESPRGGEEVVVIDDVGHMPAYVPAELLADAGASVTLVTGQAVAGAALDETTQVRMLRRLAGKGVRFLTGHAPVAVERAGVRVRNVWSGGQDVVPAATVVVAIANVAADDLLHRLQESLTDVEIHAIGDTVAPRTALEAVRDGHLVGRLV
jgi:2,4-dienoyl-CoA reductase-like NADH-dependent reductase (Old Yellow Enzyme family)/thioredoxin reductase